MCMIRLGVERNVICNIKREGGFKGLFHYGDVVVFDPSKWFTKCKDTLMIEQIMNVKICLRSL